MKRILSIILTICLLAGLLTSFAFADTVPAYIYVLEGHVDIFSNYYSCSHANNGSHNRSVTVSGMLDYYFSVCESGSYNIDFHSFKANAAKSYTVFSIEEGITVYAKFYGVNEFVSPHKALGVSENSKLVIELADNSSVKFAVTTEDVDAITGTVEMKDGSALPAPDENGDIIITKGTPAECTHTYEYNDADYCSMKCGDTHIANVEHITEFVKTDNGHKEYCWVCEHYLPEEMPHSIYYRSVGEEGCEPYCDSCDYTGDIVPHDISEYLTYDDKHCIKVCVNCGHGDEESGLVEHQFTSTDVLATEIEAAHTHRKCTVCGYECKEYEKSGNIFFELKSESGVDWDDSAIIVLKNGIPLTLVRNYSGYDTEDYALPYDKDASYTFMWLGRNYDDVLFGAKIYLPDSDEPVFEEDDMSWYNDMEIMYDHNVADYSKMSGVLSALPENYEYYTSDSVKPLKDAILKLRYLQPKSKQAEIDALADEIKSAAEGLAHTEEADPSGLICLTSYVEITTDEDTNKKGYFIYEADEFYEYDGEYVVFDKNGYTDSSIYVSSTTVDITLVSMWMNGNNGNIDIGNSDVKLTALGTNILISEVDSSYAGIEVSEGAKLTITDKTDAIIAIGDEYCAGIGSYGYYDDYDGYYENMDAGEITIDGGVVFALSTDDGAGIGGGYRADFEKITINGGRVHAECMNNDGAGIGVGEDGEGGDIIINGGDITALSLDDDGAGIGGADSGYVDSITINGGHILVGSDDGVGIGGGSSIDSYGGKIIINGGIIRKHFDDSNYCFMGNEAEESNKNFVQINGGNIIIGDGDIMPKPKNKNGKPVFQTEITVAESLADKEVELKLSDGSTVKATAYGRYLSVFLPEDATIENWHYLVTGVEIKDTTEIFKDVKKNKWYVDAINYNYSYGFIAGVEKDMFGINEPVTRGMFITVLARIAGVDTSSAANKTTTKFTDVKSGKYYTNAIKWASENDVVAGVSKTEFKPDAPLERQQLCVMIVNFAKFMNVEIGAVESKITFADQNKIAKYAKKAVETCQMADIINGEVAGKDVFAKPADGATRAEAAQMLYKFHSEFVIH